MPSGDSEPIFESAVICEYLDDVARPRLHPGVALARARHRAWVEFGSQLLNAIAAFYNAPDDTTLQQRAGELRARFEQIEQVLGAGPFFAGREFSVVDAAFAPVFRYFDVFDALGDFGWWTGLPKVQAWRAALAARDSVRRAATPAYPALLREFVRKRGSALSRRLQPAEAAEATL